MVSPLDTRYKEQTNKYTQFFTEDTLIQKRLKVEIEWFKFLAKLLDGIDLPELGIVTENLVRLVKEGEKTTKHDVKAVELVLVDTLRYLLPQQMDYDRIANLVHFGLTSEDINSVSYALMVSDFKESLKVLLEKLMNKMKEMGIRYAKVLMVGWTHGQPATPVTLGGQIMRFREMLQRELVELDKPFTCKFGGATGGMNAMKLAYPDINWVIECSKFVSIFDFERQLWTSQVDSNQSVSTLMDVVKRISIILMGMCQDFWMYIHKGYFSQKVEEGQVGSSTMPHKINPINFENAEGNFKFAVGNFEVLTRNLMVSRMQRDLSNSTLMRNLGIPFGHFCLAVENLLKGLNSIVANCDVIAEDLDKHYEIVAEGVQTLLRSWNKKNPYDRVKGITQGKEFTREVFKEWVREQDDLREYQKEVLMRLHPINYVTM